MDTKRSARHIALLSVKSFFIKVKDNQDNRCHESSCILTLSKGREDEKYAILGRKNRFGYRRESGRRARNRGGVGKAGATVYVTGRSVQGRSTKDWPGTLDETLSQIESCGGTGVAIRCDHTRDEEVEALMARIHDEQGRLEHPGQQYMGRQRAADRK